MSIRIFATGGTFDEDFDERHGEFRFGETHLPEMLRHARCGLEVLVRTLMMIDSLDMTASQRAAIVDACRSCGEARIVITHGTDTIFDTARALAAAALGKTIVLTGALAPYAFGSSDGMFNLGSALSFAQVLPPGVYVALHGRCDAVAGDGVTPVQGTSPEPVAV